MTVRTAELPDDLPRLTALFAATEQVDGYFPLTEEAQLDLVAGPSVAGLVEEVNGVITGYAHRRDTAAGLVVDVAVHPAAGVETPRRLLAAAVAEAAGRTVRVWGSDREVVVAATALGLVERRRLLQYLRPLPAPAAGEAPAGIAAARFIPGRDEDDVLAVNNAAFVGHPDNEGWTGADLADRMARDWFDPGGLTIARLAGRAVGVCWTKVHPGGVGEIYLIAVHPEAQRRSLGRWLTLTGLEHLHDERGAVAAMLYTESDNAAARALYGSLGFGVVRVRRMLERR